MSFKPLVLFIFRRDLRLEDHKPLQAALDYASDNDAVVLPMFIFSKDQVKSTKNFTPSRNSINCLFQSLEELDKTLKSKYKTKLHIFYDDDVSVISQISKNHEIYAIFETMDYTPYAKERSLKISKYCDTQEIEYQTIEYLYLIDFEIMKAKFGKIYQKFTPFYNAALKISIPKPDGFVKGPFIKSKTLKSKTLTSIKNEIFKNVKLSKSILIHGGRSEGLKFLKNLKSIKNYDTIRNQLPLYTSNLSVHHHYGTVSIRESYYEAQKLVNAGAKGLKEFQRQLFWRDFYGALCANFDKLYKKNLLNLVKERPKLSPKKMKLFNDWCNGTTGIDIVDASMNQLNENGFMHNRGRLLCASILCKTWQVNWQYGAGYFAEKLVDYDFTQNTMNWLFVSGGYPFSEPPFRKVNPERQSKLLDAEGVYRKLWLS